MAKTTLQRVMLQSGGSVVSARQIQIFRIPSSRFRDEEHFEALLEAPEGIAVDTELTFQVEALGPKGALLATSFYAVVVKPAEPNRPRKITEESAGIQGRRAPYVLKFINEPAWKTTACWGSAEWSAVDSGCYQEPTQSSPLVLIINEDSALLKSARDAMLRRKLDEV